MQQKVLLLFIFSFAFGVAFRSLFDFGIYFTAFVLVIGIFIFSYNYFVLDIPNKEVLLIGVFIVSAGFGLMRFDVANMGDASTILDNFVGSEITTKAVIVDEPDEREFNTKLTIQFKKIFLDGTWKDIKTKAIVSVDMYPKRKYGDEMSVSGILKKPKNFFTDKSNIREFDYVSYLGKDGIYYQMFRPNIKFLKSGEGNFIKGKLFLVKHLFLKSISNVIPEPNVSLMGGLVVGAKNSLGKKLLDDFRKTGVIHIVVLSGYNITIVVDMITRLLSFAPKILGISFGGISIILFAMMVGGGATVVRASVMALLVMLARATGRPHEITIALFVAGFIMVLINPKILVFDPSFQLSFLATLGLIYLSPIIERYFKFVPSKWQLREFATATISTQIFVLPILLYQMGEISVVSLPVNLLILIFIPITMLFGFITGVVGIVSTTLSLPFAVVSYWLLAYELKVVEVFSLIPFATISVKYFPVWVMFFTYIIYFIVILKFQKNIKQEEGKKYEEF
jgi:competence protein ComEC